MSSPDVYFHKIQYTQKIFGLNNIIKYNCCLVFMLISFCKSEKNFAKRRNFLPRNGACAPVASRLATCTRCVQVFRCLTSAVYQVAIKA